VRDPDTIAAIATPWGASGVGIIRVSGPLSQTVARRMFRSAADCPWESHHLYRGDFLTADGRAVLDEGLAVLMRKPRSFTGEDVFEIHAHGNPVILQAILEELMKAGCRPAAPGEFSKRAFLNGRMDLSQAEALASMIAARSQAAYTASLFQLKGSLTHRIDSIRLKLIDALAHLEVSMDFDVDVVSSQTPQETRQVDDAADGVARLIAAYDSTRRLSENAGVVIAGRPNVGKSSLLNALAGEQKAIVTDIPGTTRDLITHPLVLDGFLVRLTDTAGIRAPQDDIEKEGINLVQNELSRADGVILVLDGSRPLTDEDRTLLSNLRCPLVFIVINKSDLTAAWREDSLPPSVAGKASVIRISAKTGDGLDLLKNELSKTLAGSARHETRTDAFVLSLRHKLLLEQSLAALRAAQEHLARNVSPELAAFELREAIGRLDEITGRQIGEDVLDRIFSGFCIGK